MKIKVGTAASETLTGTAGWDMIYGLGGNDTLKGLAGQDTLSGGDGNDTLQGGTGNDILHGGAGADTFKYQTTGEAVADNIVDFSSLDKVDFSAIATRSFIGNTTFNGVAGEIRYDYNFASDYAFYRSGYAGPYQYSAIEIDTDGDAIADVIVTLDGAHHFVETALNSGVLVEAANLTYTGTADADTKTGGAGNDKMSGLVGNDTLIGGEGDDRLFGGDGNDLLNGGLGYDRYEGGTGNDIFRFSEPDGIRYDLIKDFTAGDHISINMLGFRFIGDADFTGQPGEYRFQQRTDATTSELIFDFDGDGEGDTLIQVNKMGRMLQEQIAGSNDLTVAADQTFAGTAVDEDKTGGKGNDSLNGNDGNDTLKGGYSGNDILNGGIGNDRLEGATGDDRLIGGTGNDTLIGGQGLDNMTGGGGSDTFKFLTIGELGTPTILGAWTQEKITDFATGDTINFSALLSANPDLRFVGVGEEFTGEGNEIKIENGFTGTNIVFDLYGNDNFLYNELLIQTDYVIEETAPGSLVFRAAPNLTLTGTAAAEERVGGNGHDTLSGGGGNDTLIGGFGDDSLTGGTGDDVFKYLALKECGGDDITDFTTGQDKIDFSHVDANIYLPGTQHFTTLVSGLSGTGTAGELMYSWGNLGGDVDGDGNPDFTIQVRGTGGIPPVTMALSDFILS